MTYGPDEKEQQDEREAEQDRLEDDANAARWYGNNDLADEAMRQLDE
jgi:hypothetical protein